MAERSEFTFRAGGACVQSAIVSHYTRSAERTRRRPERTLAAAGYALLTGICFGVAAGICVGFALASAVGLIDTFTIAEGPR